MSSFHFTLELEIKTNASPAELHSTLLAAISSLAQNIQSAGMSATPTVSVEVATLAMSITLKFTPQSGYQLIPSESIKHLCVTPREATSLLTKN